MEIIIRGLAIKSYTMFKRKAKDILNRDIYDCDIILNDVENIKTEKDCVIITFKDLGYSYPVTLFKQDFESIVIMQGVEVVRNKSPPRLYC